MSLSTCLATKNKQPISNLPLHLRCPFFVHLLLLFSCCFVLFTLLSSRALGFLHARVCMCACTHVRMCVCAVHAGVSACVWLQHRLICLHATYRQYVCMWLLLAFLVKCIAIAPYQNTSVTTPHCIFSLTVAYGSSTAYAAILNYKIQRQPNEMRVC